MNVNIHQCVWWTVLPALKSLRAYHGLYHTRTNKSIDDVLMLSLDSSIRQASTHTDDYSIDIQHISGEHSCYNISQCRWSCIVMHVTTVSLLLKYDYWNRLKSSQRTWNHRIDRSTFTWTATHDHGHIGTHCVCVCDTIFRIHQLRYYDGELMMAGLWWCANRWTTLLKKRTITRKKIAQSKLCYLSNSITHCDESTMLHDSWNRD